MGNILKISFLFLLLTNVAHAQVSEYEYKAAFIERFTRFVEWPENSNLSDSDHPFKIAVIGENSFGPALVDLFTHAKVKNKEAEITFTNNISDLLDANLVFVSSSEKRRIEEILSAIAGKPILIISDSRGFCEMGTHINMYKDGAYIRYEINPSALEKSGLKVNSLLLTSAKIVEAND